MTVLNSYTKVTEIVTEIVESAKKFYVTTPIYYVNDVPHIGHAYTTIIADIITRWHRLKGEDVFFLTGLDENSIKTVQAAEAKKISNIQEYVDEMAEKFKTAWNVLDINYDDFIRTTEERHRKNVVEIIKKVYEKGDIYKGKYEGLYCEGCEAFLLEKDLIDGKCPDHKIAPKQLSEENYFFRLSKYRDQILKYIEDNPDFVQPESRRNEMVNFLKEGLRDISISRPNLKWGIDFPLEKGHKVWVWFDALINYLIPNKYWPAEVHLMAKDILRFHAITWPGMLISAGYPLPKKVFAHGYFTISGQKMSKSLGNAIDPVHLAEKYTADAVRYCLLREIILGEDGDFSEESLKTRINTELVANFSNLFYRTTFFLEKNFAGTVPSPKEEGERERELKEKIKQTKEKVNSQIESLKLSEALFTITELSSEINKYFQDKEPWKTIKTDKDATATTLYTTINAIRSLFILLYSFTPRKCEIALNALGCKPEWEGLEEFNIKPGSKIKAEMLFKKIE